MDVGAARPVARPPLESDARLRGRQLGDFVLRECIGQGGFATVYRCDQPLLGREAVVKVLHNRLSASDVVLQRFMREARLASRLDHPYAAHVYAFGVEPEDGLAWIAMELVHGTSLEQWIKEHGPLPLDMLVSFFEQVAEVVQNAHDHGIVHRDLKPSNVMLVKYAGRVFPKLLDFGIAKMRDDTAQFDPRHPLDLDAMDGDVDAAGATLASMSDSGSQNLTQANTTLGSPPYMSPEQWRDPLSVGPRSDLYSLGIMAYEALTGRQPFTGATIPAIAELHCSAEVPPVGEQFSPELDRVFRRVLAKEPEERPATVLEFARELRAAARTARKTDPPPVGAPASSPKRRLWSVAAGAVVLVGCGVVAYTAMARASGGEKPPVVAPAFEPAPPPVTPAPPPPVAPPVEALPKKVDVQIQSTPKGAEVFRLPSGIKVGVTPWKDELPSETGVQVFLVRKSGYQDGRVEVDLREGGTHAVKLQKQKLTRRSAPTPPPTPTPTGTGPIRRKGEPVDPFGKPRP